MTPSMMPIVRQSSTKTNVWYNTGHGHLGWTLSAYTGQAIADRIRGYNGSRLLLVFFITSSCNHSRCYKFYASSKEATPGNTIGTITGGAGIAIETSTGKSVTEHVWELIKFFQNMMKRKKRYLMLTNYKSSI